MPKSNPFTESVRKHRARQLIWTRDSVRRLDRILRRTATEAADTLRTYVGDSVITRQYLTDILADLRRVVGDFGTDYRNLMPLHLVGAAQIIADREADIARALLTDAALQAALQGLLTDTTRTLTIREVGEVSVQFGRVAERAVNATYQRVYADGLTLSDRIWRLEATTRQDIEDRVVQAIAQQKTGRELARDIRQYLQEPTGANARYNAMRLARTELSTAAREGHVRSATKSDGTLKDHIASLGMRLSASHVVPDVCDFWTSRDAFGLGPGNYPPDAIQPDHVHGLCYYVSVLKSRPDLQFVTKEPMPVTSWPPSDDDLVRLGTVEGTGKDARSPHEVDAMIRGVHKLGVKPTKDQRRRIREHVAQAEFHGTAAKKLRTRQSEGQWVGATAAEYSEELRKVVISGSTRLAVGERYGGTVLYAHTGLDAVPLHWRSPEESVNGAWVVYSADRGKILSAYQATSDRVTLPGDLLWWK